MMKLSLLPSSALSIRGGVAGAVLALASPVAAATIDLTDGVFTGSNPAGVGGTFVTVTETAAGVDFSFTSTANLVGIERWLGSGGTLSNGLQVGGGGGSTVEFELTVSEDVTLTGYGTNESLGFVLGFPTFDILEGTNVLLDDAILRDASSTNLFNVNGTNDVLVTGLSIDLFAGTTYTFDINGTGAAVQSFFTSFEFDTVAPPPPPPTPAVPLPAGFPMLMAGVGALAWMRRKS